MHQNHWESAISLLGRVFMAWLFIPAGISKIMGFSGSVAYAQSVGMPLPELGVFVGLCIEVLGGLMLLVGFKTRYAALFLAVFTLVAGFMFHAYWSLPADQAMMQKIMFNKNIAIVGGLLAFVAWGAGSWSWDAKKLMTTRH